MTIRKAGASDSGALVPMMRDAYDASGMADLLGARPDDNHLAILFRQHLASRDCIALVDERDGVLCGFLLAACWAHPIAPVKIAKDTGWWVSPCRRGFLSAVNAMLDAFEAWAAGRNCKVTGLAGMGNEPRVGLIYRRRGYVAAETHFVKRV